MTAPLKHCSVIASPTKGNMMRQVKASEVKPGMTIRWERSGFTHEGTVERVTSVVDGWLTWFPSGASGMNIESEFKVTVLAEPQPEEPKAFGAKVIVNRRRFLRSPEGTYDDPPWLEEGTGCRGSWAHLCSLGPVMVVPDPGWAVPDNSPEVLDRIDEWDTWDDVPEGVVVTVPGLFCHYRKNQGVVEFSDPDNDPEWTKAAVRAMPRIYGPWIRVPADAPEVPERIEKWPEDDDEHLRVYRWVDSDECEWRHVGNGEWRFVNRSGNLSYPHPRPCDGPWTRVKADTPEVPDRIEEWPEDDTALRPYPWRDDDGYIWRYEIKNHGEGWTRGYFLQGRPLCGPWIRVS